MILDFTINLTAPNIMGVVTGLRDCVVYGLDQTPAGAPCRRCIFPSLAIPWDSCCDSSGEDCSGGQLGMAVREVYGSTHFPQPAAADSWRKCGPRYVVARIVVSVTRCVPVLGGDGAPPPCDQTLAAAIKLENDRTAVRQSLQCCLSAMHDDMTIPAGYRFSEWMIAPSATVGESGGCAGSETEVLVGWAVRCNCPGGNP